MFRKVVIADCPGCGQRPTLYTVKSKNEKWHHIGCTTVECHVCTKQSASLGYVLQAWNNGSGLQQNGNRYYTKPDIKRRYLETVVGV